MINHVSKFLSSVLKCTKDYDKLKLIEIHKSNMCYVGSSNTNTSQKVSCHSHNYTIITVDCFQEITLAATISDTN